VKAGSTRNRRKSRIDSQRMQQTLTPCVGPILLDLRNALRQAERCRRALSNMGYSRQRWQEIVNDVDPELRFMVRPKMLDKIIIYLRSAGEPVDRNLLIQDVSVQSAVALRRIRQIVTANLHNTNLELYGDNKVGLPEWKKKYRL
jgi:hypothetical protein